MVATSQAPATLAGLEILRKGGDAADAAIAAAAALCVAEPMSNGLGGDCFALVWDGGAVHGLDAGGAAPKGALAAAPSSSGPSSVVVPAMVAGWAKLSERFGRLGLDECLRPAIDLAEAGVAAGFHCAAMWSASPLAPVELGRAPKVGEVYRVPGLARSLRDLAERGPGSFYTGETAEAIASVSWLDVEDLGAVSPRWVEPLSITYRGVDVFEMPPPTQGIAALEALGLLERLENRAGDQLDAQLDGQLDGRNLSSEIRAVALALEDARAQVRDRAEVTGLIAPAYLDARSHAPVRLFPEPSGGTVYLCALDSDGMAVSLIQSLYGGFGSGVVVPGTGIVLNNRASCFEVSGAVEPGRRPYHTTIPGLLVENGRLRGPFGVMGGFIQAQAHLQLVSALVDRGLDPQAALDLPRFRIDRDVVWLEEGLWGAKEDLERGGWRVQRDGGRFGFGGGQAIQVQEGRILGGSDARKDGFAAGH